MADSLYTIVVIIAFEHFSQQAAARTMQHNIPSQHHGRGGRGGWEQGRQWPVGCVCHATTRCSNGRSVSTSTTATWQGSSNRTWPVKHGGSLVGLGPVWGEGDRRLEWSITRRLTAGRGEWRDVKIFGRRNGHAENYELHAIFHHIFSITQRSNHHLDLSQSSQPLKSCRSIGSWSHSDFLHSSCSNK